MKDTCRRSCKYLKLEKIISNQQHLRSVQHGCLYDMGTALWCTSIRATLVRTIFKCPLEFLFAFWVTHSMEQCFSWAFQCTIKWRGAPAECLMKNKTFSIKPISLEYKRRLPFSFFSFACASDGGFIFLAYVYVGSRACMCRL